MFLRRMRYRYHAVLLTTVGGWQVALILAVAIVVGLAVPFVLFLGLP